MAKMLMPTCASGVATDTRIPVSAKSSGPSILKQRQLLSHFTPSGTFDSRQTIESSPAVRVIEKNSPLLAQAGIALPEVRRHTAKVSGKMDSVRVGCIG